MPSYLMLFFTDRDLHRVYNRNYSIKEVERELKIKYKSNLQEFIDSLSLPDSIGYLVFLCAVSVIGIVGEYKLN